MKELKEKLKYDKKGITLIALVITIIVLLILAGVTIATLTGDNGILSRAAEAKNKTEEAQEKEGLELTVTSSQMKDGNTLEITKSNLEDEIRNQFGNNKDFTVTDNEDGSFLVNMNDTKRMYYIDENGKIIDQSKMLKISTADGLKSFRDDVNNGNTYEGWYVYLANDIALNINEEWEPIGLYPMENSSPDDESNKPFKGIFDGCGYEIDGIYINTTNKVQGLFGLVIAGKILNLGIADNCSITGGISTAGVVSYLYDGSKIVNCYNKAKINTQTDNNLIAGVAGQCIKNSSISTCYNTGEINGQGETSGGICGQIRDNSIIKNCYNSGKVMSKNGRCGGIVGAASTSSTILSCYNNAEIYSSKVECGGIVGRNVSVNISDCYNTGTIIGESDTVGGICGTNEYATISNCYNIGNINASNTNQKGGIIGNSIMGFYKNCYYLDGTTNSSLMYDGIQIKTSQELKGLYLTLGSEYKFDSNNINNGYPILQWQ